jgi:hypothetical protein
MEKTAALVVVRKTTAKTMVVVVAVKTRRKC